MNREAALLSALVSYPEEISDVAPILRPEDFTERDHEAMYAEILAMVSAGTRVDAMTLLASLEASGRIAAAGGKEGVFRIAAIGCGPGYAAEYAKPIREASQRRAAHTAIIEAGRALMDLTRPLPEIAGMMEAAARAAVEGSQNREPKKAGTFLSDIFKTIEAQSRGQVTGLKTGFFDLDQHTSGFQPSDLIVLGGRPRMGKTALATDIAFNVGIDQKLPVLFFELEMRSRQIVQRNLFSRAKVNGQLLRRGKLPERDFPRLAIATGPLQGANVWLDDTVGLTPLDLFSISRRHKMKHGLSLVVVDNIQKMRGPGKYNGNKRLEIADITNSLKNIAKDLDVPILAISHLSRGPDMRADHEPNLADLQESGNIEQDADIVMLLYREEVYAEVEDARRGETKLILAKYRDGQEGHIPLHFNEEFSSFANWAGNRTEPPASYKDRQTSEGFYGDAKH
jgi:replicative DNA helicase